MILSPLYFFFKLYMKKMFRAEVFRRQIFIEKCIDEKSNKSGIFIQWKLAFLCFDKTFFYYCRYFKIGVFSLFISILMLFLVFLRGNKQIKIHVGFVLTLFSNNLHRFIIFFSVIKLGSLKISLKQILHLLTGRSPP